MRIRIRLDRTSRLVPSLGDVLLALPGSGYKEGSDRRWKVVGRSISGVLDEINNELYATHIDLDLEAV